MEIDFNDPDYLHYITFAQKDEQFHRWREVNDWENIEAAIAQAKEAFPNYISMSVSVDYDYEYEGSYFYVRTQESVMEFHQRQWKKWQNVLSQRARAAAKKEAKRKEAEEKERLAEVERINKEDQYRSMIAEYGPKTWNTKSKK